MSHISNICMFIAVTSDKGERERERFTSKNTTYSFNAVNPVDKNKFLLFGGAVLLKRYAEYLVYKCNKAESVLKVLK